MKTIVAVLTSLTVVSAAVRPTSAADPRRPERVPAPEILRYTPNGTPRTSADDVREQVNTALQALVDAEAARRRGATADSQREAMRKAADKIVDWREMAEEALGRRWTSLTPAERDRFARLLAQLFERLYLPIIERTGELKADIGRSIVFAGETVKGDTAVVRMVWKRSGRDVAIHWSMRRHARGWRIHDVVLDGISVVDNYRAQFDRVIQRSSYDDLVARMESKISSPSPTGEPPQAMTARLSAKPRRELSAGDLP